MAGICSESREKSTCRCWSVVTAGVVGAARGVAAQAKWQGAGSAPRSGRGGRRFKSYHSDHFLEPPIGYAASYAERNSRRREIINQRACRATETLAGERRHLGKGRHAQAGRSGCLTGSTRDLPAFPDVRPPARAQADRPGGFHVSAGSTRELAQGLSCSRQGPPIAELAVELRKGSPERRPTVRPRPAWRRRVSTAKLRATRMSQAAGSRGGPFFGQFFNARRQASWNASSAESRLRK